VGLLANSRPEDRGVVTSLRNFLRTTGGAFGLIGASSLQHALEANRLQCVVRSCPTLLGPNLSPLNGWTSLKFPYSHPQHLG
jgi:hypothetical protein